MAQRLVRVNCKSCTKPYKPLDKELDSVGISRERLLDGHLKRGEGCPACMGTGYKGRMGIYELLVMNNDIKSVILKGGDATAINDIALKTGMVPLRDYGIQKAIDGLTTLDEILRVC